MSRERVNWKEAWDGWVAAIRADERARCARLICPHCRDGHPHRQMAEASVGGPRTRAVYDLHEKPNVGGAELVECWATAIWEAS